MDADANQDHFIQIDNCHPVLDSQLLEINPDLNCSRSFFSVNEMKVESFQRLTNDVPTL